MAQGYYSFVAERRRILQQEKDEAGLVRERYPSIARIHVEMTYHRSPGMPVLMERIVNFYPWSPALFNMKCKAPGCEHGRFDLDPIIGNLVRQRGQAVRGSLRCRETASLPADHARLDYSVLVTYASSR
jgi:hypothetical protein